MTTFQQIMEDGKLFKVFIDQVLKNSTYVPLWKQFMDWDYTPNLTFQAYMATGKVAAAASVINFAAGKPVRTRPTLGQLSGTIATLGDSFQMDKKMIRKILELEERIAKGEANLDTLFNFLFNDMEAALIAPHKRLDHWVLSGMSTGTITVDSTNNPDGVIFEVALSIPTYKAQGAVWAINTTTQKVLTDIRNVLDRMRVQGFIPDTMRMTRNTFNKMIVSSEMGVFNLEMAKGMRVSPVNYVTVELVNNYFSAIGLPNIVLVDAPMALPDGSVVYPFADNRVVFTSGNRLGTMQYTYANEQRSPETGKNYTTVDNVLLSTFTNDKGRFLEYELNAFPAFEAYKSMAILKTDVSDE